MKKRGFGILQALIFLVLVSFLMMISLKTASVGVKHVSDSYLKERAELFMYSAIENSVLAIEGYERNSSSKCLESIKFYDKNNSTARFIATTKILRYYCYDMSDCPCDNAVKIDTEDSHGTVLMSTVVETNPNNPKNNGKKIKITRVTLQRP